MLKKILIGLVVVIVIFAGVVATRPTDFRIVRSATIAAPTAAVFAQVNDLHNWGAWDPWAKMDPNAKNSFDGPASGKGAIMRWAGNNQVGEGSMTLLESQPNEVIRLKLEMVKPMACANDVEFSFKSAGSGTTVTWTMSGKNSFIGKAFCMFMDMDKEVGGDFEKGLAALKTISEAGAK